MDKRRLLRDIVNENNLEILKSPDKLAVEIKKKDIDSQVYAAQVSLFLSITRLGVLLQDQNKLKSIGKSGYEALITRAVREGGLLPDVAEGIGNDLLYGAGYSKSNIFLLPLPDIDKLPPIYGINGEVRGREAYECAMIWLKRIPGVVVNDAKINLIANESADAKIAYRYLYRAAKDGCEDAYGVLGLFYYYGFGVEADEKRAMEYLLKSGALTKGNHTNEKLKVVNTILDNSNKEKNRKYYTMGYSMLVLLCFILINTIIDGAKVGALWFVLSILNILVATYLMFVHKGTKEFRNLIVGSSFIIWMGFILQLCL